MKEYRLQCHEQIRLDGGFAERIVFCRQGVLWVTQTGNPGDHLLRAGETFLSNRSGRIVITALADSLLAVEAGNAMPELHAGVFKQAARAIVSQIEVIGRRLQA